MTENVRGSTGILIRKSGWSKITVPKLITVISSLTISVALAIILENAWLLLGLLIPLSVAVLVIIQIFLLKYDYAAIYKERIFFHNGFIKKEQKEEVFTGVKNVKLRQTVMGRLLGYGDIEANFYSAGIISIKNVKNPASVVEHIEGMIVVSDGTITHITVS